MRLRTKNQAEYDDVIKAQHSIVECLGDLGYDIRVRRATNAALRHTESPTPLRLNVKQRDWHGIHVIHDSVDFLGNMLANSCQTLGTGRRLRSERFFDVSGLALNRKHLAISGTMACERRDAREVKFPFIPTARLQSRTAPTQFSKVGV